MGNDRKRTGLGALAQAGDDDFSVITAIGGPRGVVESMLPGFLFVVMFVVTSNLQLTIIVSAALAVWGDTTNVETAMISETIIIKHATRILVNFCFALNIVFSPCVV